MSDSKLNSLNIRILAASIYNCSTSDLQRDEIQHIEQTLDDANICNTSLSVLADKLPALRDHLGDNWVNTRSFRAFFKNFDESSLANLIALADNIEAFTKFMVIDDEPDIKASRWFITDLVSKDSKYGASSITTLAAKLAEIEPNLGNIAAVYFSSTDSVRSSNIWNGLSLIAEKCKPVSTPEAQAAGAREKLELATV